MEEENDETYMEDALDGQGSDQEVVDKGDEEIADVVPPYIESITTQNPTDNSGETNVKKSRVEVKKPSSKWVLFLSEHRAECSRENPGLSFAEIAKLLAEQYKTMSSEESDRLDAIIQQQKSDYDAYREAVGNTFVDTNNESSGPSLIFPLVRIRCFALSAPNFLTLLMCFTTFVNRRVYGNLLNSILMSRMSAKKRRSLSQKQVSCSLLDLH